MTDQIQITLDRSHVEMIAENYARQRQAGDWPESVRIDDRLGEACRTALTNPTRSDEELRSAAVDVLRRLAANSDARSDLTKRENDAIIAGRGTEDFADEWLALRDEAKELAQESRGLLSALSQTVEDPPPTAPGEESQSVSEGVNDDAIRLIEAALLKADHELRSGGAHRDAFSILSAAMNQLRTRLIATNPSPPEEGVRLTGRSEHQPERGYIAGDKFEMQHAVSDVPTGPVEILIRPLSEGESNG